MGQHKKKKYVGMMCTGSTINTNNVTEIQKIQDLHGGVINMSNVTCVTQWMNR
jgi:hypothetical protein